MLKIGISQRVEVISNYNEQRDCLDQQWSILSERIGIVPVPIPNHLSNPELFFEAMDLNGFILSGGNDLSFIPDAKSPSLERDITEKKIMDYASGRELPILGVCRGFQVMNVYFGGKLAKVDKHVAIRHQVKVISGTPLYFGNVEKMEVNSYHNLGIGDLELGHSLQKMAIAEDGTIEAIYHETLPWIGIMWHPEREKIFNPTDINLIQNLFHLS